MNASNIPWNLSELPSASEEWMEIVLHGKFTSHITAVASVVATHADGNGISSPQLADVCEESKLEPEDARDGLQALVDMLLLESVPNPGEGSRYRLTRPDGTPIRPDAPPHLNEIILTSSSAPTPEPDAGSVIPNLVPSQQHFNRKPRPSKRPKTPAKRTGVRRQETVLYRYYDAEDVLLYVGVSANMPGRLEGHEADSTWMDFAHWSTLEHFPDRADAEAAEIAAIETDRPIFNILHNETPDRVRRIVDYLIDRDRRDLLVPLISRG